MRNGARGLQRQLEESFNINDSSMQWLELCWYYCSISFKRIWKITFTFHSNAFSSCLPFKASTQPSIWSLINNDHWQSSTLNAFSSQHRRPICRSAVAVGGFCDQNKNCTAFQVTVINILEIMQSCGIRWSCITTIQLNLKTFLSLLARTRDSFSHLPVLSSHDDVWLHLFWRCRLVRCFLRQSCWRNRASGGKETGRDSGTQREGTHKRIFCALSRRHNGSCIVEKK